MDLAKKFSPTVLSGFVSMTVAMSASSLAQDKAVDGGAQSLLAGEREGRTLEEVVVSARRREESMQDVPIAVSVLSGEELIEAGAMKIDAVGRVAPNVHFEASNTTSGVKAPAIFIRGVGQGDFIGVEDPSIGIYVDGVYLGRNIGNVFDIVDIERVEVLRGPQGTLFGANTIGGAVNIVSTRPSEEFGGQIRLSAGDVGYREINGTVNVPISDKLAGRISAFSRQRDGYVTALQYDNLELGNDDMWGARGRFVFDATENFSIDLSLDYSRAKETPGAMSAVNGLGVFDGELIPYAFPINALAVIHNTARSGDPATCNTAAGQASSTACFGPVHSTGDRYETNARYVGLDGATITPEQDLEVIGSSLTLGWDLGPVQLKSITAYREFDIAAFNDLDNSPHIVFHNSYEEFSQDQISQEFQLNGSAADGRLNYVAGLFYFEEDVVEASTLQLSAGDPANGNFSLLTDRLITNDSTGVFGQINYDISDSLTLTAGLRWTESNKYIDVLQTRTSGLTGAEGVQTTEEVTPLLSLVWNLSDDVMFFGTYSEGFKNGGFAGRFPNGLPDPLPSYDPEFVDNYELGMKAKFLDGRMRLNTSVFMMDYQDMQVSATDPDLPVNVSKANLGEATIRGLEAELTALLGENFTVGVNLGLLDDEIDRLGSNGTLVSSAVVITTDNDLPYTPDYTLALMAKYEQPLANGAKAGVRADYTVKDDFNHRIENTAEMLTNDYRMLNLSATYESGKNWMASLSVINATDEDYWLSTTPFRTLNYAWGMPVRPRTYQVAFQYNFGD